MAVHIEVIAQSIEAAHIDIKLSRDWLQRLVPY